MCTRPTYREHVAVSARAVPPRQLKDARVPVLDLEKKKHSTIFYDFPEESIDKCTRLSVIALEHSPVTSGQSGEEEDEAKH